MTLNTKDCIYLVRVIGIEEINISPTYYNYFHALVMLMEKNNRICFKKLIETYEITQSNLDSRIKPILKKNWLIKKHDWERYINPAIVMYDLEVPKFVIDLFEEENLKLYKVKNVKNERVKLYYTFIFK